MKVTFQENFLSFSKSCANRTLILTLNPLFSLIRQFSWSNFKHTYLEHFRSKLSDSCSSGSHHQSLTSFMHNTFSFGACFMLIQFVQENHASFDQFYQNGSNSRFIAPMKVRLVPKFSRLIVLQFHEGILVWKCTKFLKSGVQDSGQTHTSQVKNMPFVHLTLSLFYHA